MSTLSPRMGLTLPDITNIDSMAVADNILSGNYDIIDRDCHCRLVTALTDVVAPFNGQHVRNTTDTKHYFRKNGAWVDSSISPPAGSVLASSNDTVVATASFSTVETKLIQTTFTAIAGHRYLIQCDIDYAMSDLNYNVITQRIRYETGAVSTTAGTLLLQKTISMNRGVAGPHISILEFTAPASVQYSIGIFALRTTGAGSIIVSRNSTDINAWALDWG